MRYEPAARNKYKYGQSGLSDLCVGHSATMRPVISDEALACSLPPSQDTQKPP